MKSAAASSGTEGATSGTGTVIANPTAVAVVMLRLPSRPISTPAIGIATMAPAAIARSTSPSAPSPRACAALTAGMCGIQLASTAPFRKNTVATARRARTADASRRAVVM